MSDPRWPQPWHADRVERDPDRVALLIPGLEYSARQPLLHFAGAVFAKYGWTTQAVWWPGRPPQRDGPDLDAWFARQRSFVHAHVGHVLDRESAPKIALVGKSMGALAGTLAADRGLPGVWLTPVLRDAGLVVDLRRTAAPFLLVGGTADRGWDPGVARELGRPFHEASGADHGMEIEDDPVASAGILRDVTIAIDAFVRTL
jgi:hypothetical protein